MEERLGFNYRKFAEKYGLDGAKGGGVFMWREIWDEGVSRIYADTLSMLFLLLGIRVKAHVHSQKWKSLFTAVSLSLTYTPFSRRRRGTPSVFHGSCFVWLDLLNIMVNTRCNLCMIPQRGCRNIVE